MTDAQIAALIERLQNAVEEIAHNLAAYPLSPERDVANCVLLREIKTISQEIP